MKDKYAKRGGKQMAQVDKLSLLQAKKAEVEQGGGAEKIAKQHEAGKMTARERIKELFDENSFVEIDAFEPEV